MDFDKIIELVKTAGDTALSSDCAEEVKSKGKWDYVTDADLYVSDFLKTELKKIAPGAGFFCEEEAGALSDPCFILDPIDGTTNLVHRYPMSSVSLAYYENGRVVFGAVYDPYRKELFYAEEGKGAFLNGKPISVSKREREEALIEFGAGVTHKNEADKIFTLAESVFKSFLDLRRVCSSAISICYIAAGRLDGYFERVLKPWDLAAASLVLKEAGGVSTDWKGEPILLDEPTTYVAGTFDIHSALLKEIGKVF